LSFTNKIKYKAGKQHKKKKLAMALRLALHGISAYKLCPFSWAWRGIAVPAVNLKQVR
jgi:hypothetical protein